VQLGMIKFKGIYKKTGRGYGVDTSGLEQGLIILCQHHDDFSHFIKCKVNDS
jgi:hypothetical protein